MAKSYLLVHWSGKLKLLQIITSVPYTGSRESGHKLFDNPVKDINDRQIVHNDEQLKKCSSTSYKSNG